MAIDVIHDFKPPDLGKLEVVERKGLGHPDTLVDGIVESAELEYARYCRENFGVIPHHNLDKAALIGGLCVQQYGGGRFERPIRMLFLGRASQSFADQDIPISEIQDESARAYFARVMPHLDTSDPSVYKCESQTSSNTTRPYWFSPRSVDDLPEYLSDTPHANDTATMVSYWPLTDTEKLSLDIEGFFYNDNHAGLPSPRFDTIGQDIKVMCVRIGELITATVCVPQVTTHTPNQSTYFERQHEVTLQLMEYIAKLGYEKNKIELALNTLSLGPNGLPYLVTGGSCIDFGEEGAVGRGNKNHGIISSFRPNTMEAPHGKNPTYFVGKILGYQADLIAKTVFAVHKTPCQVVLHANIGDDLFDPSNIIVSTQRAVDREVIENIIEECLGIGRTTTDEIIDGNYYIPRTNAYQEL